MSEWIPIESAPRDGTRVIISKWGMIHDNFEDFQADAPRSWHLFFAITAKYIVDGYWTDGMERLVEPTHWMPLPSPPETHDDNT